MACFLVSTGEAIVVTAVAQVMKKNRQKKESTLGSAELLEAKQTNPYPWDRRLMFLAYLLWGGVILLAFEHVWHGEVVPWFPFLTAMYDPGDTSEMLYEMSTVGVTMACLVTGIWGVIMLVLNAVLKRSTGNTKHIPKEAVNK